MDNFTIISPNMIKIFLDCPAKFYYKYSEQIPTPVLDKSFKTGKKIHALASYYLKNFDIKNFEQVLTPVEHNMWDLLKNSKYFSYKTEGIEKSMACNLGKYHIGGRIDAIVQDNNKYYILDYKTGGIKNDMTFDPQTMVYLLLCDKYFKEYDELWFVYLDLKNEKETKILFTPELKNQYLEKLEKICRGIYEFNLNKYSPAFDTNTCKCEFTKLCKYKREY